jgi:predicted GNAT superfamily acetyltransferase
MVAFAGSDPIGVLIGAKRPSGTLVHRIAVHPEHRRQGHARHLLASLGSKLAILGPPRIVAEVPEGLAPACDLFGACGFAREALLTDYVLPLQEHDAAEAPDISACGLFVIPVTVDDLAANGLLGEADQQTCWTRSIETLSARKDGIAGLAVASDERIEAYLLYTGEGEILALRALVEDDGVRLRVLLAQLRATAPAAFRIPKVHPAEISRDFMEALGFRPAGVHRLYAARARAD